MTIEQTIADEIARVHVEIDDASDAFRQRLHDAVRSWANVHRQNQELQALVNQQREEIERLQQENTERRAALESYRILARGRIAELEAERSDLRESNHAYAKTLADLQASIGREEDDDLVEAARSLTAEVKRLIMQDILKRERAERAEAECELHRQHITQLEAESEGRRQMVLQAANDRRAEWVRAERAEADNAELLRFLSVIQASISVDRDVRKHIQAVLGAGVSGARMLAVVNAARAYKAAVDAQSGVADALAALFRVLVEMEQDHDR